MVVDSSPCLLVEGADAPLMSALTAGAASRGYRILVDGEGDDVPPLAGALHFSSGSRSSSLEAAVAAGPTLAFRFLRRTVARLAEGAAVVLVAGSVGEDAPHLRVADEALLGLARAAAEDLRSRGIRVRCLGRGEEADADSLAAAVLDAVVGPDLLGGLRVLL